MKTLEEKIEVMQAALDGAEIEVCGKQSDNWAKALEPCWDWAWNNYRIKPQPKEIWVNEYINCPDCVHSSCDSAIKFRSGDAITRHYREVIE